MKKYIIGGMIIMLLATAACTASPTPNPTAAQTLSPEQQRQKAYEETPDTRLLLGAFLPPSPHLTQTQSEADACYALLAQTGIRMVYTHPNGPNNTDMGLIMRTLNAGEKNGLRMMVALPRGKEEKALEIVEATKDHPAVHGYIMADEPKHGEFAALSALRDKIKEIVSEDKVIMCNLFPNVALDDWLAPAPKEGREAYLWYLNTFMQTVRSDVISFDFYPFYSSTASDKDLLVSALQNFCDIHAGGKAYGADTWGFVQNSSWLRTRIPNEGELRFLTHLHLLFGLKSYSYFLYSPPSDKPGPEGTFEGMITFEGEPTEIYGRVKAQNEELFAMKGVFLSYENTGLMQHNLPAHYRNALDKELLKESFGGFLGFSGTGKVLAGCFEKEGKKALYVLNTNYAQMVETTLLTNGEAYRVWGAKGLEQMGKGQTKIILSLRAGEGMFIELG